MFTLVRTPSQSSAPAPLYSCLLLDWVWTPSPHVTEHGVVDIHSLYLQPKWMKKSKLWKIISLFMLLSTNHVTGKYPRIDWRYQRSNQKKDKQYNNQTKKEKTTKINTKTKQKGRTAHRSCKTLHKVTSHFSCS